MGARVGRCVTCRNYLLVVGNGACVVFGEILAVLLWPWCGYVLGHVIGWLVMVVLGFSVYGLTCVDCWCWCVVLILNCRGKHLIGFVDWWGS